MYAYKELEDTNLTEKEQLAIIDKITDSEDAWYALKYKHLAEKVKKVLRLYLA